MAYKVVESVLWITASAMLLGANIVSFIRILRGG
jgi:hypothetical protein